MISALSTTSAWANRQLRCELEKHLLAAQDVLKLDPIADQNIIDLLKIRLFKEHYPDGAEFVDPNGKHFRVIRVNDRDNKIVFEITDSQSKRSQYELTPDEILEHDLSPHQSNALAKRVLAERIESAVKGRAVNLELKDLIMLRWNLPSFWQSLSEPTQRYLLKKYGVNAASNLHFQVAYNFNDFFQKFRRLPSSLPPAPRDEVLLAESIEVLEKDPTFRQRLNSKSLEALTSRLPQPAEEAVDLKKLEKRFESSASSSQIKSSEGLPVIRFAQATGAPPPAAVVKKPVTQVAPPVIQTDFNAVAQELELQIGDQTYKHWPAAKAAIQQHPGLDIRTRSILLEEAEEDFSRRLDLVYQTLGPDLRFFDNKPSVMEILSDLEDLNVKFLEKWKLIPESQKGARELLESDYHLKRTHLRQNLLNTYDSYLKPIGVDIRADELQLSAQLRAVPSEMLALLRPIARSPQRLNPFRSHPTESFKIRGRKIFQSNRRQEIVELRFDEFKDTFSPPFRNANDYFKRAEALAHAEGPHIETILSPDWGGRIKVNKQNGEVLVYSDRTSHAAESKDFESFFKLENGDAAVRMIQERKHPSAIRPKLPNKPAPVPKVIKRALDGPTRPLAKPTPRPVVAPTVPVIPLEGLPAAAIPPAREIEHITQNTVGQCLIDPKRSCIAIRATRLSGDEKYIIRMGSSEFEFLAKDFDTNRALWNRMTAKMRDLKLVDERAVNVIFADSAAQIQERTNPLLLAFARDPRGKLAVTDPRYITWKKMNDELEYWETQLDDLELAMNRTLKGAGQQTIGPMGKIRLRYEIARTQIRQELMQRLEKNFEHLEVDVYAPLSEMNAQLGRVTPEQSLRLSSVASEPPATISLEKPRVQTAEPTAPQVREPVQVIPKEVTVPRSLLRENDDWVLDGYGRILITQIDPQGNFIRARRLPLTRGQPLKIPLNPPFSVPKSLTPTADTAQKLGLAMPEEIKPVTQPRTPEPAANPAPKVRIDTPEVQTPKTAEPIAPSRPAPNLSKTPPIRAQGVYLFSTGDDLQLVQIRTFEYKEADGIGQWKMEYDIVDDETRTLLPGGPHRASGTGSYGDLLAEEKISVRPQAAVETQITPVSPRKTQLRKIIEDLDRKIDEYARLGKGHKDLVERRKLLVHFEEAASKPELRGQPIALQIRNSPLGTNASEIQVRFEKDAYRFFSEGEDPIIQEQLLGALQKGFTTSSTLETGIKRMVGNAYEVKISGAAKDFRILLCLDKSGTKNMLMHAIGVYSHQQVDRMARTACLKYQ